MTISGTVKNGVVVPDGPVELPEGAMVRIQMLSSGQEVSRVAVDPELQDLRDKLLEIAGTCDGLPEDYAYNHDHYLYGTPKNLQVFIR